MKMEQCSETSAYKIQTLRNYPEGSIKHSEHGESLKSRIVALYFFKFARTSEVLLKTDIRKMKFICANNSHVETVKYLTSKNYSFLILIDTKNVFTKA